VNDEAIIACNLESSVAKKTPYTQILKSKRKQMKFKCIHITI